MQQYDRLIKILTDQGYIFEFLKPEDIELHREFVQKNWPNSRTRANLQYNKWKLRPGAADRFLNLIVCKKDGKIIGQLGFVAGKIAVDDKQYDAYWGCNFKVNDELKNLGIGACIEIFAAKHLPVLLQNTPSQEALKYKKQLGYHLLEGPRILMFPVRADYVISLKTPDQYKKYIPLVSAIANPLLRSINAIRLASANYRSWAESDEQGVVNRIRKSRAGMNIPYIVHNIDFLTWRCNPPQEVIKTKPRIVVSIKNDEDYVIYNVSGKLIYLYEYNFSSRQFFHAFIKYVLRKHRKEKITTIEAYTNTNEYEKMFKRVGFIALRRKCVITAFSSDNIFEKVKKMHVDLYDGEGNL